MANDNTAGAPPAESEVALLRAEIAFRDTLQDRVGTIPTDLRQKLVTGYMSTRRERGAAAADAYAASMFESVATPPKATPAAAKTRTAHDPRNYPPEVWRNMAPDERRVITEAWRNDLNPGHNMLKQVDKAALEARSVELGGNVDPRKIPKETWLKMDATERRAITESFFRRKNGAGLLAWNKANRAAKPGTGRR